ncbi:MAG: PSD1 and planctomycete cytochrome C domain-containing protein [Bacteroidota bacterium]
MNGLLRWLILISLPTLLWVIFSASKGSETHIPDEVSFNFHVRPLLSQNCFSCHGPDPTSRKADLRLDTEEGAKALLESGIQAIVEGDAEESGLWQRIHSEDPEMIMPPPESKKVLTDYEKAILEKWIEQGADWEKFWAFVPPKSSQPSSLNTTTLIDQLIEESIEEQDLALSPRAPAQQRFRRLSYVLTGLPPSLAELEAFRTDTSQRAYAGWVEYYLASPRFGERWARHWMDLMRYADTQGHEFDYAIDGAWRYRDYLIRAFNQDVPYDQLVREHLAGDLLERPRRNAITQENESVYGTMYMALGEGKHSPVNIKQEEADRIDNNIDLTSKAFLGLTVSCARCHDHKFDPIPTKDYYQMYGLFESARFHRYGAGLGDWEAQIKKDQKQMEALRAFLNLPVSSQDIHSLWPDTVQVLADFRNASTENWIADGPAFRAGNTASRPLLDEKKLRVKAIAMGSMRSDLYGKGIPGALRSPNFTLDKDIISLKVRGHGSVVRLIIENFQLIQFPIYGQLERRVYNDKWHTVQIDNLKPYQGRKAYLEILPGIYERHNLKRDKDAWIEVQWAVAHNGKKPSEPAYRVKHQAFQSISEDLIPQKIDFSSLQSHQYFTAMKEGGAVYSPVFERGQVDQRADTLLPHAFLSALGGGSAYIGERDHRLDFAESIVSPDNPIAARVMVNRLWHYVFGRGLVATPDNFGLQGKLPTHPELLDELALRFQTENWSIKAMLRAMVLSETFQRASVPRSGSQQKDPQNLYLSHFSVRRLEAEAIRDGILAVSGCLDTTMYGETVPIHLTEFMRGRGRPRVSGPLDGMGRRSVYQGIRRNFLPPFLQAFDFPVPFTAFGKRNVSNVPAQSLSLMNDPFVQEQARYWAENNAKDSLQTEARISLLYEQAFARSPRAEEIKSGQAFLQSQALLYPEDPDAQAKAWADYTHMLINLKEFIFLL